MRSVGALGVVFLFAFALPACSDDPSEPCGVDERVEAGSCVPCSPGSSNTAGDDPSGANTSCDATLCQLDQRVVDHACTGCAPGTRNAAGDDASGANTTCDAVLCQLDQHVVTNACVACPPGSTNAGGDDASGANTSCDGTLCPVDRRVVGHACVACPAGTTNAAGDDASGVDTSCDATLCLADQRVVTNACVACPPGSTNAAGDNASGANTSCDATLCSANQRVVTNACVACPPGSTNAAGDDATGANTTCDATLCPADQHVVTNACVACAPGTTNAAGDDASGANTSCDATLCLVNQHVMTNACVACPPGTTNSAGDNASGANTSCDVTFCSANQHVVTNACVACPPGSTNAAGDNATGANTSCDATLCSANQRVMTNACVACPPGSTNAAGDDATGVNTSCDATLCPANQRVVTNACVACPPGTTNAAGDDASGANTSCDATLCSTDQHVVTNACVACPAGTTNPAGDNASGPNTSCDGTLCPVDFHVVTNACVACPPGTTNAAGDDASGANTSCDVTLCPVNQRVLLNACVACPAGESNPAGDDASGGDTACERFSILRLTEIAPNQTGSRDLIELRAFNSGTLRDMTIEQDGVTLATLPDITVSGGQLIVVHLNPAAGVTTELTSQAQCTDAACYPGVWDINGGTTGITYTRRVLAVVDPLGDNQDVAAFSNLGTTPASYATELQTVQASSDWLPSTCAGSACTDATTPSANDVSADWTGCGTGPTTASVQRRSTVDTNAKADWEVAPGNFGVLNPGPCVVNERVVMNTCVACPAGQSNAAGDDPAGANTACDVVAILRLTEVAPSQTGSRDLVELVVLAGGAVRDITIEQDGVTLATLPDITVSAGQLIVVHLNPAGSVTELTSQAQCVDPSCYPAVWDVNGGTTGIANTRRVIAVVDPSGDEQDVAAFTNLSLMPASYVSELQAVQGSGDWVPSTCGGTACTDATTPSANDVSVDWSGCGTGPTTASVQRRSTVDTDAKADWGLSPGNFGVLNPGPCAANQHVVANTCVACPAGQSNLPGDDPAGANTACDAVAVLQLAEIAPNQNGSRDLVELLVLTGGTTRDITFEQDGVALATLPDVAVSTGQRIVVHLNPAGPTTELTTQGDCIDPACYSGAWDFNGGTTAIAYSRRVLAVADPSGDIQDAAAFSNLTMTPGASYLSELQAVQASGDWLPSSCGGSPCTDATTPSANTVSANWLNCGMMPTSMSVRRTTSVDTHTSADWTVAPGTFGAPP